MTNTDADSAGTTETSEAEASKIIEGFTPQVSNFYMEEIEPRKQSSVIGYHREFLEDLAKPLLEAMDTIPGDSIEYLGFAITLPRNTRITRPARLDAYYWDETTQVFYAYVSVLNSSPDAAASLDSAQLKQAVNDFSHFVEYVDFIAVNGDRSDPAVALARSISQRDIQPVEYRLTVVSDMVAGSRLTSIQNSVIGNTTRVVRRCCLNDLVDLATSDDNEIVIDFTERRFRDYPIPLIRAGKSKECTSYLCAFPGIVLAQLYQEYSARLLEGNVRVFLGLTKKINREMKETILREPNLVFAFNNGLSVTATEIDDGAESGELVLKKLVGMKIVNGGQTTATIAAAYSSMATYSAVKDVFVPMKINIVNPGLEQELVPRISKYANSQNAVSKSAFESNSPFQIQMERIVNSLVCDTNIHWTYERLEGAYKQEAIRHKSARWKREHPDIALVIKEDFAKYMAILKGYPHIAAEGKQKCFMKTLKLYELTSETLKEEVWAPIAYKYCNAFVLKVLAVAIFVRSVQAECKARGKQCAMATALYTVAVILRQIEERDEGVFPYEYVWKRQHVPPVMMNYAVCVALEIVKYLTDVKHISKKGKEVLIPTEWAKAAECWEQIKNWPSVLPDDVASCLMVREAWDRYEEIAQQNYKDAQERSWKDALFALGVNGWDLMLEYLTKYPIGADSEQVQAFKDALEQFRKNKNKLLVRELKAVREIHNKIRAYDARLLGPLI